MVKEEKEDTVEPAHVEPVRSSLDQNLYKDTPLKKDCQRTSPAEENIVFGEPESYWKKILRHCVVSSTIQRENPSGARIQWHDSHEAIKHDWYAILTSA